MTLHIGSVGSPIRANTMEPEVLRQAFAMSLGSSFASGIRSGVVGTGDFSVSQNGTPNMSVNVGAGFAYVAGTLSVPVQGAYNVYNDGTVNVTIPTANATFPRIDVICITIQDAYYSGSTNTAIIQDIAGTAASSPTVPSPPANSLAIAHVYVGAGVSSITNSNINTTGGTNNPDTIAFAPTVASRTLARFVSSSNSSSFTATSFPGAVVTSLNVNIPANRLISITAGGRMNTASDTYFQIYRSSTGLAQQHVGTFAGNLDLKAYDYSPPAGMAQYILYGTVTSGSQNLIGNATEQWSLAVSDEGPSS